MQYQVETFTHPDTGFNKLPSLYEVSSDERVYTLWELNLVPPDSGLARRYQIIVVWRDDVGKCQYSEDMGLATLFINGPKCVQSAALPDDKATDWCYTVAEVKDLADQLRGIDMEKILGPEHEDLVQGYHDGIDEHFLQRKNVSVSGPLYKTERKA